MNKKLLIIFLSLFFLDYSVANNVNYDANLLHGALIDNLDEVKNALHYGANVNAEFPTTKVTALHLASANGSAEIVDLLLSKGANVNARDIENFTPLYEAIKNNKPQIVNILLDNPYIIVDKNYLKLAEEIAQDDQKKIQLYAEKNQLNLVEAYELAKERIDQIITRLNKFLRFRKNESIQTGEVS